MRDDVEYFLESAKIAACWLVNRIAFLLQWVYIAVGTTAISASVFPSVEETIFRFLFLNALLILIFVVLRFIESITEP